MVELGGAFGVGVGDLFVACEAGAGFEACFGVVEVAGFDEELGGAVVIAGDAVALVVDFGEVGAGVGVVGVAAYLEKLVGAGVVLGELAVGVSAHGAGVQDAEFGAGVGVAGVALGLECLGG